MFVSNWLTFPGVIHHELSHAILAFFTGAKITELKLFWPDKKTGTLGQVSFVPRGVFIFRCIQMTLASSAPVILGSLTSYILIEVIRSGDYPIYITAIIVYLIFSILIHAYMSIADVKIMLKGIWTLFFVILAMCFVFHVDITQL
jgi:hypothetical protein